jgi:membrane protease YdiL (CAAX protease family)
MGLPGHPCEREVRVNTGPRTERLVMSVVRRHRVIIFFLLACALSWGAIPWNSFFAPGVLVAALLVVSVTEGVVGLKAMGARLIRWRVSWVWYALALAVPLFVVFAAIALNTGLGAPAPDIVELSVWYSLPMAIAINMVNPTYAQLPEESSFRGWAQPTLQATRSPLAATVLMAIGVTIWHGPLFMMPQFGLAPIEAVTTVAVTFWYAWLFNHASGSSLLTLIAHATEGAIETSTLWPAEVDATRMTWLNCLVWCAVVLGLLMFNRRFWTRPPARTNDPVFVETKAESVV